MKGDSTRYYFLVCKDIFDQSIYMEFVSSRRMDMVLEFLVHAWQHLGLPEKVQFDNGREFCGWGKSARYLSQVIRLCLHLSIEVVFIPEYMARRNGSVENINGWFQPLLLRKPFHRPCDVRRELRRLMQAVNEEPFAVLYSDEPSRPNTPINILTGLDWLKSASGWSDEEMYHHFCYDLQVRYALGIRDLGKEHFELRTMYNFRRRVAQHMQETGENLYAQALEQIADE